jgi:hypothetical protein
MGQPKKSDLTEINRVLGRTDFFLIFDWGNLPNEVTILLIFMQEGKID